MKHGYKLLFIVFVLLISFIKVYPQSGWNVNPSAYEYNASVIAEVYLNGSPDAGEVSAIGAFAGGECRGVASPSSVGDKLIYFLTVYSNSTSESISFQAYLPGPGLELSSGSSISFIPNGVYGSIGSPEIVSVSYISDHSPSVSNIPDQTIEYGASFASFDLDDYLTELDGDNVIWSYSGNSQLIITISNQNIVTVQKPNSSWSGSESVTFRATDDTPAGKSGADNCIFTITVLNEPPVIEEIPPQTTPEGSSFGRIYLDNYVSDPNNTAGELIWTCSGANNLSVLINSSREADISPKNSNWFGSETLTFKAQDPGGLFDTYDVLFTVTPVNDPPVISNLPTITFSEGNSYIFRLSDLMPKISDVDNSIEDLEISYSYTGNKLIITENPPGVLNISSPPFWSGTETINIHVTDQIDVTTVGLSVIVGAVNHAPIIGGMPDQIIINAGSNYRINLWDYVSDFESADHELNFIVISTNGAVTWEFDKNYGELIIYAAAGFTGTAIVIIVVVDDSFESSQSQITVMVQNLTDVDDGNIPLETSLSQNYPNPFNPTTTIEYSVLAGETVPVELKVFDITGKEVAELISKEQSGGKYQVTFDAQSGGVKLPSGVYFYILRAGSYYKVNKMLLLK